MLQHALLLKKYLNDFLSEIRHEEPNYEKRNKLDALMLSKDEWERVQKFVQVLDLSDRAQQAFSTENAPILHNGIPALEALHAVWSSLKAHTRYSEFWEALTAGLEKIEAYYEKTADSHAYTFAMHDTSSNAAIVLDLNTKMSHFKKHWSTELQDKILTSAEKIFKERYVNMYSSETTLRTPPTSNRSKIAQLLAENSSDDKSDSETPAASMPSGQGLEPWCQQFSQYLNSINTVPDGMTLAHWWGMNAQQLPVWASLTRDHLAIMASSVSSERAFSAAGITISKRRNRLRGDVIEALQFLKCAIRSDLLFREPAPSLLDEIDLEEIYDDDRDPDWVDVDHVESWDVLINVDSDVDDN
ncbi:hypothetical protein DXG01_005675 [Tephrocybe rancida]|nr:hypothetical protein DXG01_005675 [Tephrocybe rancida]